MKNWQEQCISEVLQKEVKFWTRNSLETGNKLDTKGYLDGR